MKYLSLEEFKERITQIVHPGRSARDGEENQSVACAQANGPRIQPAPHAGQNKKEPQKMKTGKPVLDALIAASEPLNEEVVRLLPIKSLHISNIPGQRRPKANEVAELAASMKVSGQITPAIVREDKKGSYEIAAGARRFVAAQSLGWKTLACVVRDLDDDDFELKLLVENLQRLDPDPCEEVKVVERLVGRGVKSTTEISAHLGKTEHWAARRLRLLHVIPKIRQLWEKPERRISYYGPNFHHFTLDMMEFIGSLPVATQEQMVKQGGYYLSEARTRKELEKQVERNLLCRLDQAPFDLKDSATFVNACGPGCANDSSKQASLFDFGDTSGRCLNPSCFRARAAKARSAQLEKIEKEHGKKLPVVSSEPAGRIELEGNRHIDPTWAHGISSKPTKENTLKAIVVKDGKLDIGYIPKESVAAQRGVAGSIPEKAKSKSLSEKKSALQARRWKLVHDELCKVLAASTHKDCTETVEDVVAIFGLAYKADHSGSAQCWIGLDNRKKKGFPVSEYEIDAFHHLHRKGRGFDKDRRAALWNGLKPVFQDVMAGWYRVGDIHKAVPAMRRVAKLISFPIEERKRAADLTIKVPRTWGSGLDVHTLEPIKLRELQIAADSAHKKIHRKKSSSRTAATRYLDSSHEHIRFAESLEKRR